jgi:hypothetical protein
MAIRLERTRDRIIVSAEEVQIILKNHIEKESGRKIDGDVLFQQENASHVGPRTSVYVHLHHKDEVQS